MAPSSYPRREGQAIVEPLAVLDGIASEVDDRARAFERLPGESLLARTRSGAELVADAKRERTAELVEVLLQIVDGQGHDDEV
jgi:hypothetical protein